LKVAALYKAQLRAAGITVVCSFPVFSAAEFSITHAE
jgi:hypothetical protein